jgi:murein endopeptidase
MYVVLRKAENRNYGYHRMFNVIDEMSQKPKSLETSSTLFVWPANAENTVSS